jgi:arsenate reductase (thioredoxin)
MINVLFICVHNAGRSQMAEAFFNKMAPGGMKACSAGTEPANNVNTIVVQAMAEKGIDIATRKPRLLISEIVESSQRVITMGCGVSDTCPVYLGLKIDEDWELDDPAGKAIEEVRSIRDIIFKRVEKLIDELNGERGD